MATARPARRRRSAAAARTDDTAFHAVPPKLERAPRTNDPEETVRPGRFPKEAVVWALLLGLLSFASSWYIASLRQIPNIFLAADIGLVALFTLTLRSMGRIVRSRIHTDGIAVPGAAVPKAAAWSLGVFWFFATLTNVLQLAVGLGAGILAYQLYASKARITREGYGHATRFGPAFAPTLGIVVVYVLWFMVRDLAGPLPGFDLASLGLGIITAVVAWRVTDRASKQLVATPKRTVRPRAADHERRGLEKKAIAGVIGGYLFFRFFISSAIPYGPIVEWFLVCVGALFIAIIMADRIGVVPTRRALPHPDARIHIQRILSLPDRSLEESDKALDAFIRRGEGGDWVATRFRTLYLEAGIPPAQIEHHLAAFRVPEKRGRYPPVASYSLEARERLVQDLINVLQTKRRAGTTGTLKAEPAVRNESKTAPPAVAPAA